MKKLLMTLSTSIFIVAAACSAVSAYSKGEQDCSKCHTINAEQAKEALREIIPDVKVIDVQNGPINGFWEVGVEFGGRKQVLYLDYSKKNVVSGNIYGIKSRTNYTQLALEKINKIDYASIPLENSLVMGDKNAKHKVVVFDDPD